ncbi:MAG: GNAT family N-acetyltransferase [Synechococcaceae cyanobacterium]|nr:GNAT family N-acetyltransferase [Synechococcaceae cyanobacterium]
MSSVPGPDPRLQIRRLQSGDRAQVIEVYGDAVRSQAPGLYTPAQIEAWAAHPGREPDFPRSLARGYGLVSCSGARGGRVEAFALLDPSDRLSLLYCRGSASRQGRGTALVRLLEARARQAGFRRLRTEASRLSRPLLERLGWRVDTEEEVILAGETFLRWRMIRDLG